jgi:uncharacterized protein (UPF0305 family)
MSKKESPKPTSFTMLDRPLKYLKMLSAILDVSMSQVLNDILEYMNGNFDESDIWEDWKEKHDDFEDRLEEAKEESESKEEESED